MRENLSGGIIDVPLEATNLSYVYQMVHKMPILGGPGIDGPNTRPAGHLEYVTENTFLQALDSIANQPQYGTPRYNTADLARLKEDGFGVVVIHRSRVQARPEDFYNLLGTGHISYGQALVAFPLPDL